MVWVLMLHAGTRLCFPGNTMQPFISRLGNKLQEVENTAGKELVSKQHPQQELRPPLSEETRENVGFKTETDGILCYLAALKTYSNVPSLLTGPSWPCL